MTDDRRWYVPPTDPDEARRHRETIYLEILYRGRQLADTAPPRTCLNYPECPEPCKGCQRRQKRFDAWTLTQ